ncbi:hypothetical protein [Propionivibrio sp.]
MVINELNDSASETFIARWQSAGGSKRANYQLFITEQSETCGLTPIPVW